MKKLLTLFLLSFSFSLLSQVFNGNGGAIIDNGGQETYFSCYVSNMASVDSTYGLIEVTVNITHPDVNKVQVKLIAPWGGEVDLSGVLGLQGANYVNTTFNSSAVMPITSGAAPYSGSFRPVGYLGRFNVGKTGTGTWKLMVKDFELGNSGSVNSWSIKFGAHPPSPVVFRSSNLPIVFINTLGQTLGDNDIVGTLGVIDNGSNRNYVTDHRNNYNGKAAFHIRGSSSKMFEKQNIKIELRDNSGEESVDAPLAGMPVESDWILTAFYADKTLLRNPLTHYLFQKMGRYSPRNRYVEVVLNDEYFGVYMLIEQPKHGTTRVNVEPMNNLHNSYPKITGGYIIQLNRSDNPGWYSLYPGVSSTAAKFYYQYNYPKADKITTQQKTYIKAVMDTFETVMASASYADPSKGYKRYIEDDSFVDFMILNELSKNVDAYRLSTYLYKNNIVDGGKIHIGPMWDYDLAWCNSNYGTAWNEWQYVNNSEEYPVPTWWEKFMQDPAFTGKVYCRYHTLRQWLLSNNELYEFIDENAAMLTEAQTRNFKQFPIIGTYIYGNPQTQAGATYQSEVKYLKDWIYQRSDWLDKNIPGYCQDVGLTENGDNPGMRVHPNPVAGRFTITLDESVNEAAVTIYDISGNRVLRTRPADVDSADIHVECECLPPGIYLLELNTDGKVSRCRIVKQ